MTTKPPIETPMCPGVPIPTFIFSPFNKNQKPGPGTQQHWGYYYTDRTPVYDYAPLPAPKNNVPYKGKVWCMVAEGVNEVELAAALSYACNVGNMICDTLTLSPGI
ncbi:glucan endo-1,3-beta-glucosidase [Medicago truncatula]|uniref:glucan endo-1,3-beta-D-glucosidase n=1 Tax=Medicago truncatula TaxID=3880 RepID=G7LG52_MEDTR|nr:glucan endo-1,3-beta-glucosidase [Medicago truncatula]